MISIALTWIFRFVRMPRAALLLLGMGLGAFLAPSLTGCTFDGEPSSLRAMLGDQGNLSQDTENELNRFVAAYASIANGKDATEYDRQLDHFRDAFAHVQQDYVREVPARILVDAALKGVSGGDTKPQPGSLKPGELIEAALDSMTESLDPHSSYLNDQELREMNVSNRGEFGGLGIEVSMRDGYVLVVTPIEDTPAFDAGLKAGDLITGLDGETIKGKTLMQAVRLMRGKPGSVIRLTISRADVAPFDIDLTRAVIKVRSVRWRIEDNIGYVRVTNFSEKVEPGIVRAMMEIRNTLGDNLAGVVLDLRNNPGGLLRQSLALSDAFIDDGVIVSVRGRNGVHERVFQAVDGDLSGGRPMVVLINVGSASASEIVAAALQDHGRAIIMGQRSFGKGSVQTIMPLKYEGALRLTTQLYYSPSGRAIQARGIEPDIEIIPASTAANDNTKTDEAKKPVKRRREADLPGALSAVGIDGKHPHPALSEENCVPVGAKKDRTLGCALALLKAGSAEKFLASIPQHQTM